MRTKIDRHAEAVQMLSDVEREIQRIGVMDYVFTVEGGRFCYSCQMSDAPWFSLPRKSWAAVLVALRALPVFVDHERIRAQAKDTGRSVETLRADSERAGDRAVEQAFRNRGGSAGSDSDWDGR